MSKIILELKNKPEENDVLIFRNGGFKCLNKDVFLNELDARCFANHKDIELLKSEIEELKKEIRFLKGEDE